ncbi:regulatory protein, Fis family [Granulicella rosea]|uniref:Regulatory protein, Fis family n=1 Tax=Granulicella rosea TaxID=474952 RepID=A0A239H7G7_9BACT|nr:sigma 54-interacting transcriptional regulator [Granulicella rosea]SNS77111.1 regulatory protein, Fis family [Granulicella rosea]
MANLLSIPVPSDIVFPESARAAAVREDWKDLALLGDGLAVQRLRSQLQRLAPYFRTALLIGERGTGREAAARRLHSLSPVAAGPFVLCPALEWMSAGDEYKDLMESAQRGTLFIQEIERLPLPLQAQMLVRLQKLDGMVKARTAETRVIASSLSDLRTLTSTGQFRQDLYGRISVVEIRLTPLRERTEDLQASCAALLKRYQDSGKGREISHIAEDAIDRMMAHAWPGNFEELREVVEQALFTAAREGGDGAGAVLVQHLPELAQREERIQAGLELAASPAVERLEDVLRRHVVDVLSRCAGNKVRAAELLGISRSTLYRMLDAAS